MTATWITLTVLLACSDYGFFPNYERVMEVEDLDEDGYAADVDCAPDDPDVHPGAAEVPYNGVDDDCDLSTLDDDLDRDGFGHADDCDDTTSRLAPDRTERCGGLDEDCDGRIDEHAGDTWFADEDSDGFGDPESSRRACNQPADHVATAADCDDTDAAVHPGAPEACTAADEDCDGAIDEGLDQSWLLDADGDGFGDPDAPVSACEPGDTLVADATDCDDLAAAVHPGASETCDASDQDCDGVVDESAVDAATWFPDEDGDGHGEPGYPWTDCDGGAIWVSTATDCDDQDPGIHSDAEERCDGRDNDCDGLTDGSDAVDPTTWYTDADADGHGLDTDSVEACDLPGGYAAAAGDCDDTRSDVNPDQSELCNDGADNDCDGTDNGCTLTGELSLADADQAWFAATFGGALSVVAGPGDLDGDGLPDLVFGVPEEAVMLDPATFAVPYSGACGDTTSDGLLEQRVGAAYVVLSDGGSVTGPYGHLGTSYGRLDEVADAWLYGEGSLDTTVTCEFGDLLGSAVVGADLDGDGFQDLVVTATEHDHDLMDDEEEGGAAYVLYGPLGSGELTYDAKLYATVDGTAAGRSAAAGDTQGDGLAEVAIGGTGGSGGNTFLVGGSTARASGESVFTTVASRIRGEKSGDWAGAALAFCDLGAPDGTGPDGLDDLVVGAPGWDDDRGGVGVLFSPQSVETYQDLDEEAAVWIEGLDEDDLLGTGLACLDLDGDGSQDLVTTTRGTDTESEYVPEVLVFLGPLSPGTLAAEAADLVISGELETGTTGSGLPDVALAPAGDVNGDGHQDLILGRHGHDPTGDHVDADARPGAAWVLYGPITGDITLPVAEDAGFKLLGDDSDDEAGVGVAPVGDLNGDGFDDLVVAARQGDDPGGSWDPDGTGGGCTRTDDACCTPPAGAAYVIYGRGQ